MLLHRARDGRLPLLRDARILDTLVLAKKVHGEGKGVSNKLQDLHVRYTGKQADVAHRAMADVHANALVLHGLLKDGGLEGVGGQGRCTCPAWLGPSIGCSCADGGLCMCLRRHGVPRGPGEAKVL